MLVMTGTMTQTATVITSGKSPFFYKLSHTLMPNTQRKNVKNNDKKKLLLISEELTKSVGKNQFLSLFTKEHDVIVIDYLFEKNPKDRTQDDLFLRSRAKKMYLKLKPYLEADYSHMTFIGLGDDCQYLYELFLDKGIVFDGAVFINYDWFDYQNIDNPKIAQVHKKTKIWNLYSKNHLRARRTGMENYCIPTRRSPQFNSRYALESYGVIMYGVYGRLSLLNEVGNIKMLSNAG